MTEAPDPDERTVSDPTDAIRRAATLLETAARSEALTTTQQDTATHLAGIVDALAESVETVQEHPELVTDGGRRSSTRSSGASPQSRIIDEETVRGDPENPVIAMQMELQTVIDRYPEIQRQRPEFVATLLIEIADTLRQRHNLDHDVDHVGADVFTVEIGGMAGWVGAPRDGEYADIDEDALEAKVMDSDGDVDER